MKSFQRSVLVLFSWTVVAHSISTTAMLVLPRLFDPEQFGVFALFCGAVVTLGVVAAIRYEFAIALPESSAEAAALFTLCTLLALLVGAVLFSVAVLVPRWLSLVSVPQEIQRWAMWGSLAVSAIGCYNAATYFALRLARFDIVGKSKAIIAAFTAFGQIIAGLTISSSDAALIIPFVIAQILGTLFTVYLLRAGGLWTRSFSQMRKVAWRYQDFPKFFASGSLADGISLLIPTAAISLIFSPAEAGLYALAERALKAPITLAGSSILQAFYKRAADLRDDPKATLQLLLRIWRHVALTAALPFAAVLVFGRPLFAMVFGPGWAEAGSVASVLVVSVYFYALSYPTSNILIVYERSKSYLGWQFLQLIAVASSFVLAYVVGATSLIEAMWFLTVAQVLVSLACMGLQWDTVRRTRRRAPERTAEYR